MEDRSTANLIQAQRDYFGAHGIQWPDDPSGESFHYKWLESNLPHEPELLPFLTPEAAGYLASFKNLKVVGTDSLTVDPPGSHLAHQFLKEKLIVESLVHLHCIPTDQRSAFDLQTSPVRIIGATGGPVIAYAYISR